MSIHSLRTRYLKLILLMIGWLIGIELILRLSPVQKITDKYAHNPVWYAPYVEQRMELIRNNKDADIWFIGSSSVALGINPAIIDPIVDKKTGQQHKSLNLGLFGMHYIDHLEDYINDAFLPLAKPKFAVYGTFPTLFAFSTQLSLDNTDEYEKTVDRTHEPLGFMYNNLALFRFIYTFRYIITETPADRKSQTPTGFMPYEGDTLNVDVPIWGSKTNDRLEMNLTYIKHLKETLEKQNIHLIFVNLPFYDPLRENYPGGGAQYKAYITRLTSFLADEKIPFLNAWQEWQDRNNGELPTKYFMDFHHLNEAGANSISPVIADLLARTLVQSAS